MTTTVQQVADEAMSLILVKGAESSLTGDEMQAFIYSLNKWMASLLAMGINLGYTVVANASDVVTVPDGALDGIASNMAIKMSPQFGGIVSPELREDARDGLNIIRILGNTMNNTKYPTTLPIGSGNWWQWGPNYYGGDTP